MADATWYYKEAGESKGPVTEADLSALFSGGRLPPETPISEDCTVWREASIVDIFADVLSRAAGAQVRPPAEPLGKLVKDDADAPRRPEPRPWVRFWARCIDGLLLWAVVMPLFMWMVGGFGAFQLLLFVGLCLVLEAAMVTAFCATPGKLLLGVSVRTAEGGRLSFGQSLLRSVRVLLLGMGLGVPVVNLVTMLLSYQRLLKEGWTLWDTYGPFSVGHRPLGVGRTSMGALVTAGLLLFTLIIRPTAGAAFGTGPNSANAATDPKLMSLPASQPAGTVMIRPVTEQPQRKAKPLPSAPAKKPTAVTVPASQPSGKASIKSTGKTAGRRTAPTAKPQGGSSRETKPVR